MNLKKLRRLYREEKLTVRKPDGRRFRVLAVVDDFTREYLCLVADTSFYGTRLARELDSLITRRGKRRRLFRTTARR